MKHQVAVQFSWQEVGQIVGTGVLLLNGMTLDEEGLPEVFVRRLLENAALLEVAGSHGEIINGEGFPAGEL